MCKMTLGDFVKQGLYVFDYGFLLLVFYSVVYFWLICFVSVLMLFLSMLSAESLILGPLLFIFYEQYLVHLIYIYYEYVHKH